MRWTPSRLAVMPGRVGSRIEQGERSLLVGDAHDALAVMCVGVTDRVQASDFAPKIQAAKLARDAGRLPRGPTMNPENMYCHALH